MLNARTRLPLPVKILLLTMFDSADATERDDHNSELQLWVNRYFVKARKIKIAGGCAPLLLNPNGVGAMVTGIGKTAAAGTLTAVLANPRFDFRHTYFITCGCAGASPERGTLGDVIICDSLVDIDLVYNWLEKNGECRNARIDNFAVAGALKLNSTLARWVMKLTGKIELADSAAAQDYRNFYTAKAARQKPAVKIGVGATSDRFWHGAAMSRQAAEICGLYALPPFLATQMEDNAVGQVLQKFGLLNRYLVIRDIVNFDQPYPRQMTTESLRAISGGFAIGMENGFRVGAAVVDYLLENWKTCKNTLPSNC